MITLQLFYYIHQEFNLQINDHTNIFMSLLTDRKTNKHQLMDNEIDIGLLDSHYCHCKTVRFRTLVHAL